MMRSFTVIGAGGIGCAVGYALCHAGAAVTFIETDADKIRWGRCNGVKVDDKPACQARFVAFEDWQPDPSQITFLCTKCYDNTLILERLPDEFPLVPVQNGFDPMLDKRGHLLEAIASFVSECLPGRPHTRITRRGALHFGPRYLDQAKKMPLNPAELAKDFKSARLFKVRVVDAIAPYKLTKLMYNAAIGPLAAAAGLDNGDLLRIPAARRLFFRLLQENYSILDSTNEVLGKIGPFHPRTVNRILRAWPLAWAMSWLFYPSLKGTYCSMVPDVGTGRSEIDFYNRYLIDLAGELPCPLNRKSYALLKLMERERLQPGLERLDALLA